MLALRGFHATWVLGGVRVSHALGAPRKHGTLARLIPRSLDPLIPSLNLQPRIDWFALEGEHAEDAFVDTPKRFTADEPLQ